MDAEPPLDYLLDEAGSGAAGGGAGREELLAIMARSRSQRHHLLAVGMAATLVVGVAGGWLVAGGARRSSPAGASLAAGATTTTVVPHVAANAPCVGQCGGTGTASVNAPVSGGGAVGVATVAPGGKLAKVFVRTTVDGVTIRAYRPETQPLPSDCPIPVFPGLDAEVSTSEITAQSIVGFGSKSASLMAFFPTVVGVAEDAPVWLLAAQVDPSVALVRATFADGKTDQMAPVRGWAVLGHVAPAGTSAPSPGSVQVMDKTGKVLDSQSFAVPLESVVPGGIATGSGVASSSSGPSSTVATTGAPPKTTVPGSPSQVPLTAPAVPVPPCKVMPVPQPAVTGPPTTGKSAG